MIFLHFVVIFKYELTKIIQATQNGGLKEVRMIGKMLYYKISKELITIF